LSAISGLSIRVLIVEFYVVFSLTVTHHHVRNFSYIHQGEEREVAVLKGSDWETSKTCCRCSDDTNANRVERACTRLRVRTVKIAVPVVWFTPRFTCSTVKAARSRRKNWLCRRPASIPFRYGKPRCERRGGCHFDMNRMKETLPTKISRSPTHHRVRNCSHRSGTPEIRIQFTSRANTIRKSE
jgi:hypothetical protein